MNTAYYFVTIALEGLVAAFLFDLVNNLFVLGLIAKFGN